MSALTAFAVADATPRTLATAPTFTVPLADMPAFASLPEKRRAEVTMTLRLLERVHALRGEGRTFTRGVEALAAGYKHIRGLSAGSLLAKYYAYRDEGWRWQCLVKGYKAPSQQPKEFQVFVKGLIERNHRSAEAALRQLREEIWPSGASVPGYGTWQEWFAREYPTMSVPAVFPRVWPAGWSISNLRNYGPTRAEIAIFQRGEKAAHSHLPSIPRDTSNLRPLELITIDDFELDVMCYFPGDVERGIKPQLAYVAGLMAIDVGTRKKLHWGLGPRLEREEKQPDGTVRKVRCGLRALDVQALLYAIFEKHGLPDYTVKILCENATATISPELRLMLETVFEGRVVVDYTSILHHKTLENGFVEKGGTPWQKGWIESEFNYLWNELATLKGYKGSNERLNGPANLPAAQAYALKFLGWGDKKTDLNLPPEVITELRLPFLNPEQLETAFAQVIERSERRTAHKFRGFDAITEFRWPSPALPAPEGIDAHGPNSFRALALLDDAQRLQMVPEQRMECALERWERLSAQNPRQRLDAGVLALFLLQPNKATYRKQCVSFTRDKVGYSYIDPEGLLADQPEGTEVLAYVDRANPAGALVTLLNGKPIGTLRMLGGDPRGVDITDEAAIDEARAQRRALVNRVLEQVRSRHTTENDQLAADRAHTEAVVATWQGRTTASTPLALQIAQVRSATQQQAAAEQARAKQQARALRGLTPDTSDLLDEEAQVPAATPLPPAIPGNDLLD